MSPLATKTLAIAFASAALLGVSGCKCNRQNNDSQSQAVQNNAVNEERYAVTCYSKDSTKLLFNDTVYQVVTEEGSHMLYKTSSDRTPTARVPTESCFIKSL